jgi:hypothetical protein
MNIGIIVLMTWIASIFGLLAYASVYENGEEA